ncbi:MAG TPA: hypothetical protein VMY59_08890 [Candidatus Thermoplasmatota archaeon]|nr:hypothetical protein [Candidatus Thermoplasmatota archaeon]
MPKFGFYKTKKAALKAGRSMKKPVYKCKSGYFVGSRTQKTIRLNLKSLLTGKVKRIK